MTAAFGWGQHRCRPDYGRQRRRCRIIKRADSACAAAKEAGRNRIHSFEENDIDLQRRRREQQWAARINNALEENRFELFRQTIQPLQTAEDGAHYEILLRMRDESGGIIAPGLFIEAAERFSLTPESIAG